MSLENWCLLYFSISFHPHFYFSYQVLNTLSFIVLPSIWIKKHSRSSFPKLETKWGCSCSWLLWASWVESSNLLNYTDNTLSDILVVTFTAEKCDELVGEKSSSKTRSRSNRFTLLLNNYSSSISTTSEPLMYIRSGMREALSGYQSFEEAIKTAKEQGNAAAWRAFVETTHVLGPLLSSGWDFFRKKKYNFISSYGVKVIHQEIYHKYKIWYILLFIDTYIKFN